jgi:hypothetical protein
MTEHTEPNAVSLELLESLEMLHDAVTQMAYKRFDAYRALQVLHCSEMVRAGAAIAKAKSVGVGR